MTDTNTPIIFDRPPVVEVALGVVFAPLAALRAIHFGVYWQKIRSEYPTTEQQPPIFHQIEQFGIDSARIQQPQTVSLPFPFGEDSSRYLFLSSDRERIVQMQRDRFVTNWRQSRQISTYPGYSKALRELFLRRWTEFAAFLTENGIESPTVEQCEFTYVNNIPQSDGWTSLADLPAVISPWSGKLTDESLPSFELLHLNTAFIIPDQRGRVYVNLMPMVVPGTGQVDLQMVVTARVVPLPGKDADPLEMMDVGHHWAARSFAAVTTEGMHTRWARRDI